MVLPSSLIKNTDKPSLLATLRPCSMPKTYIAVAQASASVVLSAITVTEATFLRPSPQIWPGFLYSPDVAIEIPPYGALNAL